MHANVGVYFCIVFYKSKLIATRKTRRLAQSRTRARVYTRTHTHFKTQNFFSVGEHQKWGGSSSVHNCSPSKTQCLILRREHVKDTLKMSTNKC